MEWYCYLILYYIYIFFFSEIHIITLCDGDDDVCQAIVHISSYSFSNDQANLTEISRAFTIQHLPAFPSSILLFFLFILFFGSWFCCAVFLHWSFLPPMSILLAIIRLGLLPIGRQSSFFCLRFCLDKCSTSPPSHFLHYANSFSSIAIKCNQTLVIKAVRWNRPTIQCHWTPTDSFKTGWAHFTSMKLSNPTAF